MHGLHKCLDGVNKGEPSAIDLHDQKRMPSMPLSQAAVNANGIWHTGHNNNLQLKYTKAGHVKHISKQL